MLAPASSRCAQAGSRCHHLFPRFTRLATLATLLLMAPAVAQLPGGPVRRDSGPLAELSTNVGAGSGPVRDTGGSLRQGTARRLGGSSVRASATGDVLSGPVSDLSAGPVTAGQPVTGGGTVGQSSVGAVMKDRDSPLGEVISEPLRELGALQERLRALQPLPRNAQLSNESQLEEGAEGAGDMVNTEAERREPLPEEPPEHIAEAEEPVVEVPTAEEPPAASEPGTPENGAVPAPGTLEAQP